MMALIDIPSVLWLTNKIYRALFPRLNFTKAYRKLRVQSLKSIIIGIVSRGWFLTCQQEKIGIPPQFSPPGSSETEFPHQEAFVIVVQTNCELIYCYINSSLFDSFFAILQNLGVIFIGIVVIFTGIVVLLTNFMLTLIYIVGHFHLQRSRALHAISQLFSKYVFSLAQSHSYALQIATMKKFLKPKIVVYFLKILKHCIA